MSLTSRQNYRQPAIYHDLVDQHDIFESLVDVFVFCAALGYDRGEIDEDNYAGEGEEQGEMLWMHFSDKDLYRAAAASIAYDHEEDPQALLDPDLQLKVMAQFASAGAQILEEEIGEVMGSPREHLLQEIQDHKTEEQREREDDVLEKIARDFDEDILGFSN